MAQFGDFTVDRNSTKYVLGSGGTIISYATDEPAFEFNADGSYKGLLIEPAATNLAVQSEDISTTWISSNATITTNDTTAPDGTATADKLGDDGGGGTGVVTVQQTITVVASTKYTASVFLKADQLALARLRAVNYDGTTDGQQYFELSGSGILGTASNLDDSKIESYPNGWYRCSITWTQGASDTEFIFGIYLADSFSNSTVDLDGTSSIFVWGVQVEASPIATSYIPTTTASVTRVKDDITQTSASSLIGQTEGTLYIEVDILKIQAGSNQALFTISDSDSGNDNLAYVYVHPTLARLYWTIRYSDTQINGFGTVTEGISKIALAYKSGDIALYINGTSVSTDTTVFSFGNTLQYIRFALQNGIQTPYASHRAVALYPTRLSDAECQALTTL